MLTLIKTQRIANVTSKRWHPQHDFRKMKSSSNTKCEYINMFPSFLKRCMDIIHESYNKNCITAKWTFIKMPTQDSRERDSTETETGMKTRRQQAKRSLPGRGEDKSGLSLQVYLKGGVIRLNFRGLSWETSS